MKPGLILAAALSLWASSVSPADSSSQLQELLNAGSLTELRWPDFKSLQPDIARFYKSNGYRLAWSRSGSPTRQAIALVTLLENAGLKGLDPNNYDAWRSKISEIGPERFDLALTISAMRYMNDVFVRAELIPKIAKDPHFLAATDYEVAIAASALLQATNR